MITKKYIRSLFTDRIEFPGKFESRYGNGAVIELDNDSTLNLTMDLQVRNGYVHPTIMWSNPPVIPQRGRDYLMYRIDYYLQNCRCDLPSDHFSDVEMADIHEKVTEIKKRNKWAPSSEFVSSSIPSWQIVTAHAQPFRGARDLAFCLKVPLDSLLVWASSEDSGETARMLAWTFAAHIGDKYQIRLTRSKFALSFYNVQFHGERHSNNASWKQILIQRRGVESRLKQ